MGLGWRSQHELVCFGNRAKTHFDNHKGYGNVIECTRSGNELHPTQKPEEGFEILLDNGRRAFTTRSAEAAQVSRQRKQKVRPPTSWN